MTLARLPLAALLVLPACASMRSPPAPAADIVTAIEAQAATEVTSQGLAILRSRGVRAIVGYLPNRVMDLFDVVRFGVNLGPGLGAQVKATDPLQVTSISRTSVGIGLQSLRHLPVMAAAEDTTDGCVAGPGADESLKWFRSPTDLRVEVHPLVAGAHVAVDPVEIVDFVLGLVGIDVKDDDPL